MALLDIRERYIDLSKPTSYPLPYLTPCPWARGAGTTADMLLEGFHFCPKRRDTNVLYIARPYHGQASRSFGHSGSRGTSYKISSHVVVGSLSIQNHNVGDNARPLLCLVSQLRLNNVCFPRGSIHLVTSSFPSSNAERCPLMSLWCVQQHPTLPCGAHKIGNGPIC